ncbi:AI-2E family transporter [Fusibacter sp. JL298sf-3]
MRFVIKNKRLLLDVGFVLLVAVVLFLIRGNINSVITPFVYGAVVAYLLNPAVSFLEKKKIKRPWAILIVFVSIFLIITLTFMSFIPKLAKDVSVFIANVPDIFDFVQDLMTKFQEGKITIIPDALADYLDIDKELAKLGEAFKNGFSQLSNVLIASTGTLLDIVMTPIIAFYLLKDKDRLIGGIKGLFNKKQQQSAKAILSDIDRVLGGFIRGQFIVAIFVGTLIGIGCAVIGVPYALTIGLVAGVTNIIPYFGPWLGGILPVILALMNAPITALWVIIWIIIVQQIESSFISPQIMAQSVGLHPLTVMFSVLLFGNIFGIPGMILGVPITGTLKVLTKHFMAYREKYIGRLEVSSPATVVQEPSPEADTGGKKKPNKK